MVQKLVEHVVKSLVSKPDLVSVACVTSGDKRLVQIRVAAHDLSRVIGSEGRMFRSIRAIATLTYASEVDDVVVDIVD